MAVRIVLDAGHGINTAGKRTPDGEREWSFNNIVLLATQAKLRTYQGVEILRVDDPTGKTDVPLITRTNKANAWKPDVLVSIHHNANAGKWGAHGGVETFVQNGAMKASSVIAKELQSRIVKAMGLRDRGVKSSNLHMTRATIGYPAILTEGGFMDSTTDIGAMRDNAKLKAQGVAIAEGLATHFGLKSGEVVQASKPVAKPKPPVKAPVKAPVKKAPVAPKASAKAKLVVDGYWGAATTRELQRYFGTYVDGVISRPSPMVRALQKLLGVPADGYLGPVTYRAMQRRFGTYADGIISRPSPVVKELQRRLNNGKL